MNRQRLRDLILGIVMLWLIWLFYSANTKEPDETGPVDRVVLRISAPLDRAFTVGFDWWIRIWRGYEYKKAVKSENDRLRRDNDELEADNRILAAIAQRGRQLWRFRAYMAESAAEMLPANVVRRKIDTEKFRVVGIVIDRRYRDVGCGSPVVTPRGVVGRVLYFEEATLGRIPCPVEDNLKSRRYRRRLRGKKARIGRAMVQLTVDPASRIDVRVPRTGARGILRGLGWDKGFVARITHLDAKAKVAPGDLVVTSGVDGRFPASLPVGRILSVQRRPGEEPLVLVKPPLDYGKLTRVLVVISPPPPKVPLIRQRRLARVGLRPYP